ncbi:oligoendopeptidase [Zopfochytrium polystomum]|nr:oligoendopeptidase [Zopfochytrium polystomum]
MTADTAAVNVDAFIASFNEAYEQKHKAFEDNFWATKMNLKGASTADLTRTKTDLDVFLGDEAMLTRVKALLARSDLTADQRKTLTLFERTFACYIIQDPEARRLREQITELEAKLEESRNRMKLGYTDPATGEFVKASSAQLRNKIRTSPDEALRKACYEGIRTIGKFVAPEFAEIVKLRNRLARKLGYECFYDMKAARERLAKEKGEDALKPWNTSFALAGDITTEMDPYFPFENAVSAWARSFAAMNITYAGATMNLDLCDRDGKYTNGFCHWPQPAWQSSSASGRGWVPSVANFTSLATPGQVGSGQRALETLMHEGGHAAHFANVRQPSPLFSQERAPTSVAYAENQSMFLDSVVGDAAWLARYALDKNGNVMPWHLVEKKIRAGHPYAVLDMRAMLAVPFFERRLYDAPESDITPENILVMADEVDVAIQGGPVGRPLMMVPHILSDESAAYYHGYVLAEMSVHQTRAHFLRKYGRIVDEPRVGTDLTKIYWEAGNSRVFLDLVEEMTGAPLSGDAWVSDLKEDLEEKVAREKKEYEEGAAAGPKFKDGDKVDLDMRVRLVHGDDVIADSEELGGGLIEACDVFKTWMGKAFAAN